MFPFFFESTETDDVNELFNLISFPFSEEKLLFKLFPVFKFSSYEGDDDVGLTGLIKKLPFCPNWF